MNDASKLPTCATCVHRVTLKHPIMIGHEHHECWFGPPQYMLIPQQGPNGQTGMTGVFAHVQVALNAACFQHSPMNTRNGEVN